MITMTSSRGVITLPGILQWAERLASPHLTTMENTITGAAAIENWTKVGGIPATLNPSPNRHAMKSTWRG